MSRGGEQSWQKYFEDSDIKTTVKESGSLLNAKTYSPIGSLSEGTEIEVLKQDSYNSYRRGNSRHVRVVHGSKIGLFPFSKIAKPLIKNPGKESVPKLNILAEDFIGDGKDEKINLASGLEPVKVLSTVQQIKDGVFDGLSKKATKFPIIKEQFEKYFASGDYTKIDLTDISDTHKNELGVYFGEILLGLLAITKQTTVFHPNIFLGKKIQDMCVPTDPAFKGVDSFIRCTDGELIPISSKYGVGAKAAFFGNLLPAGIKNYNDIRVGNSVFSQLAKTAKTINITAKTLEGNRGAKEILYEYGIRKILGINKQSIPRTYDVYNKMRTGVSNNQTELVEDAIRNYTDKIEGVPNIMDKVIEGLPNTTSSFFSRAISEKLNSDTKSQTQMKEILAGKNFYQANLDPTKWKNGTVYFRLVNTGSIDLKIIGSKASLNSIDAKQGTINYEIKYP